MWLFVFPLFFSLWAAEPPLPAVEEARALALKKNRQEACAILRRSISELPANSKNKTKLTESLNQIAKVFFTDKGQKAFESGQASLFEAPDLALNQFRAAVALEDQNIQILNSIARVQLIKQECDAAVASAQDALKINPYSTEAALLELRGLACKQNFEVLREKTKMLPPLDAWEQAFVQYLLAMDLSQQKSARKVSESMGKIIQEHPQFPESYWLMTKAEQELGKSGGSSLQKYVSLCKAVGARERKKYSLEPRLCANLKEAEDELAKANAADL